MTLVSSVMFGKRRGCACGPCLRVRLMTSTDARLSTNTPCTVLRLFYIVYHQPSLLLEYSMQAWVLINIIMFYLRRFKTLISCIHVQVGPKE